MVTYDNYYGINQTKEPTKYRIIKEKNIDVMLKYLAGFGEMELASADYEYCARTYLMSIGMTESDIDALTARLVGDQT